MNGMRGWSGVGMVVAASLFGVQSSSAQVVAADEAIATERAEVLIEYARQLADLGRDYRQAASLMRDAALLLGEQRSAVGALEAAGHFHWYAERPLLAFSAFKDAGEIALEVGDLASAAGAFRNAAFAAAAGGETESAETFMARSQALQRTAAAGSD